MKIKAYTINIKYNIKFILCLFLFLILLTLFNNCFSKTLEENELYCNNNIVIDADSGNVLYEKNGYKKVYPASTTKILTAILAIENLYLEESIVVSKNAVYSIPVGSSIIYLKPGEIITNKDLLYGLLVKSGNDAANVLAESVSGSIDKFIDLMNLKLKEIGCKDTHFTNAHGFHDKNHYTTTYDMAILMRYAMQNDTFREIVQTREYTIPETNKFEERVLINTNKMFYKKYTSMYYEYVLGGKTGYTEEARGTFVGYGKKDDKLVIVCAFDGSQNIDSNEARFLDSITLFEYAFNNFNRYKVIDKELYKFNIYDKNTNTKYLIGVDENKYAIFKKEDFYSLNYSLNLNTYNLSGYDINSNIGTITFKTNGSFFNTSNEYNLILLEKSEYKEVDDKNIVNIILIITILFLLFVLKLINKKNSRKKLKRKNK